MGDFPGNRPLFRYPPPDAGASPTPSGQPACAAGAGTQCPPRLGELLIERGVISQRDLAAALARQRDSGRLLGEELLRSGRVKPRQLRAALDVQSTLRKAALCSLIVAAAHASRSHADTHATALGVHCVVPPRAEALVDYQAAQVTITEADVARGYVDVPAASKLTVTTNSRAGYIVDFFTRLPIFKAVRVRSANANGEIGPDGGTMIERGRIGRSLHTEITYRFVLGQCVQAGVYPWPLALSVRPL